MPYSYHVTFKPVGKSFAHHHTVGFDTLLSPSVSGVQLERFKTAIEVQSHAMPGGFCGQVGEILTLDLEERVSVTEALPGPEQYGQKLFVEILVQPGQRRIELATFDGERWRLGYPPETVVYPEWWLRRTPIIIGGS